MDKELNSNESDEERGTCYIKINSISIPELNKVLNILKKNGNSYSFNGDIKELIVSDIITQYILSSKVSGKDISNINQKTIVDKIMDQDYGDEIINKNNIIYLIKRLMM